MPLQIPWTDGFMQLLYVLYSCTTPNNHCSACSAKAIELLQGMASAFFQSMAGVHQSFPLWLRMALVCCP